MADLIERLRALACSGMGDISKTAREAAAALEAAREDAGMRRFADMLLGGLNDIQDALGFTDEDKLCANGSAEIVAEIAELREDAERYRWLRLRLAGAEHVAELVEFNTDMHPDLPGDVDAAIDQARGKAGQEVGT